MSHGEWAVVVRHAWGKESREEKALEKELDTQCKIRGLTCPSGAIY